MDRPDKILFDLDSGNDDHRGHGDPQPGYLDSLPNRSNLRARDSRKSRQGLKRGNSMKIKDLSNNGLFGVLIIALATVLGMLIWGVVSGG